MTGSVEFEVSGECNDRVISSPIHRDPAGWGLAPWNRDDAAGVDAILLERLAQEVAVLVIA
jgi:hypothetical protein